MFVLSFVWLNLLVGVYSGREHKKRRGYKRESIMIKDKSVLYTHTHTARRKREKNAKNVEDINQNHNKQK